MSCRTPSNKHHSSFPKFIQVACSLAQCTAAGAPFWLEGSIKCYLINTSTASQNPCLWHFVWCWTMGKAGCKTQPEVRKLTQIWQPFDHPNWFQSSFQGTPKKSCCPWPPVAGPAARRQRTHSPSRRRTAQMRMELTGQKVPWWDLWWLENPIWRFP